MNAHAMRAFAAALALSGCATSSPRAPLPVSDSGASAAALQVAANRYQSVATRLDPHVGYPRATTSSGAWNVVPINEWTSGFFPGTLWQLYAHTGDAALREQAERWTTPLLLIPRRNIYTHDLGFQYMSSFGLAYQLTGEERLRRPLLEAARLLAARFNATVGAIKSWNWTDPARPFPVIVDNMMNLELLFWGARQPDGDARWKQIAIRHARTTMMNHLRADSGSFHVVVFDPTNGRVIEKSTHQGHADQSTWARGQAWLLYGFTMAYRESGEPAFLQTAQEVAGYFLKRLPADGIACWDFQAPGCPQNAKRDASAAAIAASGLLELSQYVPEQAVRYRSAAHRMLGTLAGPAYFARDGQSDALLRHAVGHHPRGTEVDVGLVYADYYFVEALLRSRGRLPIVPPRTVTWRSELLQYTREQIVRGNKRFRLALDRLVHDADSALTVGPFTVTAKQRTPPSGDKHDYMSFGPYWWPDSTRPNGLPYIRRDGVVNQQLRRDSDVLRWYAMTDAVETLAHAYYFTKREAYAERAAYLLRTWFIDPATRMNPHLQYGQAIPGVVEGRGIGIVDTRDLGRVIDAVHLLEPSPAWTNADRAAMRQWFASYGNWLQNSAHGKDEADEANNHGTWYDVQRVAIALFLGDSEAARNILQQSSKARMAAQIDSAGRQPLELARTRSLHYSVENLEAFTRLAEMARHVDVDLWTGLRPAIDFVMPYADPRKAWPHEQITAEAPDPFVALLRRAASAYDDPKYRRALEPLDDALLNAHRTTLLYPEIRRSSTDSLLNAARLAGLPPAERSEWQRYLSQSDRNARQDSMSMAVELRAVGRNEVTPAPVGQGFFVTKEMTPVWFASPAAKQLGEVLVTYQTPSGGWSKRIDFTRPRARGESFSSEDNWSWIGTLDNGATTEQLKYLGNLIRAQRADYLEAAYRRGIDYLLSAQMPNGCWPQIYPLQGSYHDAITFNDDATVNALEVMDEVARGRHAFVGPEVIESARRSVREGIRCILATQVSVNGFKTVWAAQHDPLTLQPIKARAYEHPSLSGRESGAVLDFLMRVANPDSAVVSAVHAAAEWFRAHAMRGYSYAPRGQLTPDPKGGPLWARFYEIGTNRPIFSDRDGVIRYNLHEIGTERRTGYLWYTDEPASTLRRYDVWARQHPSR
jgi:PelA/Pel-15E family pectate lyase